LPSIASQANIFETFAASLPDFVFAKLFRKMFLVFFALDSPGQKQAAKTKQNAHVLSG
jgi:hypothetical protein